MPLDVTLLLDSGRIPSRPLSPCLPGPMRNTESRSCYSRVVAQQHGLPAIPSLRVLRYLPTCQVRPVLQALMVSLAVYSLRSASPLTRACGCYYRPRDPPGTSTFKLFSITCINGLKVLCFDLERYKVASLSPSSAFSIQIISFIFSTSSSHLLILHPSSLLPSPFSLLSPPSSPPSSTLHHPATISSTLSSTSNRKYPHFASQPTFSLSAFHL